MASIRKTRTAATGRWLRAALTVALAAGTCAAHAETALDDFDPGTSGGVSAVLALPDGEVLLGGTFATVGGQAQRNLARVRVDGSFDPTFTTDADGTVVALLRQPDGKVVVGGFFTAIGGVERQHIARLNADGSLDMAFNPSATGGSAQQAVLGLALQSDGKILLAGQFAQVGGAAHDGVARLNANGSVDNTFNALVGQSVSAVAPMPDGRVVIGGGFTSVEGQSHSHIARLNANGSVDTGFTEFLDASVNAIVRRPDGSFLVGGSFSVPHIAMARIDADGHVDDDFNLHIAGARVMSIALYPDGRFAIGGAFQFVGSEPRKNLARFGADLALDASFDATVDGGGFSPVASIALLPGGIAVVGGEFTSVNGDPRGHGARLRDEAVFAGGFD